jgi:hypothetical protein
MQTEFSYDEHMMDEDKEEAEVGTFMADVDEEETEDTDLEEGDEDEEEEKGDDEEEPM